MAGTITITEARRRLESARFMRVVVPAAGGLFACCAAGAAFSFYGGWAKLGVGLALAAIPALGFFAYVGVWARMDAPGGPSGIVEWRYNGRSVPLVKRLGQWLYFTDQRLTVATPFEDIPPSRLAKFNRGSWRRACHRCGRAFEGKACASCGHGRSVLLHDEEGERARTRLIGLRNVGAAEEVVRVRANPSWTQVTPRSLRVEPGARAELPGSKTAVIPIVRMGRRQLRDQAPTVVIPIVRMGRRQLGTRREVTFSALED